jgi:hypothetical protein
MPPNLPKAMVELTDSNKHSSLLLQRIHYIRKNCYDAGPWSLFFPLVSLNEKNKQN